MPAKQRDSADGAGSNERRAGKPYPDTEWYKKLRDVVPYIEGTRPMENPFKDLLKSRQLTDASAISGDDRVETGQ